MRLADYPDKPNISPNDGFVFEDTETPNGATRTLPWGETLENIGVVSEGHFLGEFETFADLLASEAAIGKWAGLVLDAEWILCCCFSQPASEPTSWVAMVAVPIPIPEIEQP
jgi:hypothetical protein